jgi:hypothetical protein
MKQQLVMKGSNRILANTDYILHHPDGSEEEGKTDNEGYIDKPEVKLGKYTIRLKKKKI